MRYERFKATLNNANDDSPNLYAAICAFEAVLLDMEEESGTDFAELPLGDELLSSKLVWMCRTIQSIYSAKAEELQRGRRLLDGAMNSLEKTRSSLEQLADADAKFIALTRQREKLEAELRVLQERSAAFETLRAQTEATEKEITRLKGFDTSTARKRLAALQAEQQQLEEQNTGVLGELSRAESQLDEKKKLLGDTQSRLSRARNALEPLERELAAVAGEEERAEAELQEKRVRLSDSQKALDCLRAEKAGLETELETCADTLSVYDQQELAPLRSKIEEEETALAAMNEEKNRLQDSWDGLRLKRNETAREIAAAKMKRESMEREQQAKAAEYANAQKLLTGLNEKLDRLQEKLVDLQRQTSDLETKQIPEQQRLNEAEQARINEFSRELEARQSTLDEDRKLCKELEERLRAATADVLTADEKRRALEEQHKTQSQTLDSLQDRIRELEEQTDPDKYEAYRNELAQKQAEIKAKSAELGAADQKLGAAERQLAALQAELQTKADRLRALESRKSALEEQERQLSAREQELSEIASADFEIRLRQLQHRLQMLKSVVEQQKKTLERISQTLGATGCSEESTLLKDTEKAVSSLSDRAMELQKNLLSCADKLGSRLK